MHSTNEEELKLLKQVEILEALEVLENTPMFVKLVKYYTETYQNSLVDSLATTVKRGESTGTIDHELRAISFFKNFLNQVHINGNSAKESLNLEDE